MPSSQSPADRSQLSSQTPSYQWFQVISASLSRIRLATCGLQPLATWRLGTQLMTVRCDLATAFGSCPSWDRTRTLLIQSQACCQLHQGAEITPTQCFMSVLDADKIKGVQEKCA